MMTRGRAVASPTVLTEALEVRTGSPFLRRLLVLLDVIALIASWTLTTFFWPRVDRSLVSSTFLVLVLVAAQVMVFNALGLYRSRVCAMRVVELARITRGCLILALLVVPVAAFAPNIVHVGEIARAVAVTLLLEVIVRSGYRAWLTECRRCGRYQRPILLVGTGSEAAEMTALLATHPELGYRTVAVVGDSDGARAIGLGDLDCVAPDDAALMFRHSGAVGALVCAGDVPTSQLNCLVQELLDVGAHVQMTSGLRGINIARIRPAPLAHEPLFYVEPVTLAPWQLATKRAIDLVLASMMLVVAAPLLALAAIGIKLDNRGPILFKQVRIGRDGEPFTLYKLRTMRVGSEQRTARILALDVRDGPLIKVPNDPRVTRLGRILRATSIDELPQLWNVLNGSMSLVGPRPALPDEVALFDAELRARESVPPGLTGLWQVEGRDNPSFAAYRRFDLFYIQNWSVALDLMVLLATIESVVLRFLRSLRHPNEEIPIAPPEVRDPASVARSQRTWVSR
jgi:exopolysaccharide biosynthesis polyprenyl glycosylphosphotransferase